MTSDRLQPVLAAKRDHVAAQKRAHPLAEIEARARHASPPRGFAQALQNRIDQGRYALIAEIKQASPSRGLIRANFDPPTLALAYQAGGAACLSVLTDTPFFKGRDDHLIQARAAVSLPVLRKDFVIDLYQVAESRALGADCILLIMAAVEDAAAAEIFESARSFGMDVLVEVHNRPELDRALLLSPRLVGINNRDLKTLKIDLATSIDLAALLPKTVLAVAESGLSGPADLARLSIAGVNGFLIGEALLRQSDVENATRTFLVDKAYGTKVERD